MKTSFAPFPFANRRRHALALLGAGAGSAALGLAPLTVRAQADWPNRPVRIIVPFAAGSFTENAARVVAAELHEQLGQPFIVETRGGAGSTIGTSAVAKAAADGYTLLFTDNSFMVSSALYPSLPYDPIKEIAQITPAAEAATMLLVRNDLPAPDLKALVALARTKPGDLNYGSGGLGSSAHLAVELFLGQADIRMTHVPYKGVAAALTEVAAGRIDVGLSSVGTAGAFVKGGRLRALAITGKSRHPEYPDVPTFAEAGFPDYTMTYVFGFMAPAGLPAAIFDRLHGAIRTAVSRPKVAQVFATSGAMPYATPSAEYQDLVRREIATWKTVIERAGVKP